ncbi:RNA polymerase factor sigma-54 [Hazenella sp. IB182357]|uniref:RNA polymerase factor sigma-54 n=1 Tax=Polycladospora coralii TaxID=2771432 RepID=A0A926N6K0_9BACL|nr:RNA polymerase factor sigma-54 [Polycladospora coralii]MBD1372251.1 RNA polymerase factor sigma-54 [Polycladospora coralii]
MAIEMGYGLVQDQRMKMAMTPELQQSIQMLQFSNAELITFLYEQYRENPAIELELPIEIDQLEAFFSYLNQRPLYQQPRASGYVDTDREIELASGSEDTLAGMLEKQLYELNLSKKQARVCYFLIHNLDDKGYLDVDAITICKRLQIEPETLEDCINSLQKLEPVGIGARSLAECLELQLLQFEPVNPLSIQIVKGYLPEIADGRWSKVAKDCGVTEEEVHHAVEEIRRCNPKPGSSYSNRRTQYIFPDVFIEEIDGEWKVYVNESEMPYLRINPQYQQWLSQSHALNHKDLSHLKAWVQSGMMLMKGIAQRKETIVRVAEVILNKQKAFFRQGPQYLIPLTLKEVAFELGLHESTVSRATQHKYVHTPNGIYSFRTFFPGGLSLANGEALATEHIKIKIKQIIEREDKKKPHSDQKIAVQLQQESIQISRRTVAKYREELGFSSSTVRKRLSKST